MNAVYLYGFFLILLTKRVVGIEFTLLANGTDDIPILKWPRLIFDGSEFDLCQGELSFSFKTFSKTAVLLYQDDNGQNDYLAINLVDGRLHVRALFGFNKVWRTNSNSPKKRYNDFKWYTIKIKLKCPQPCLRITVDDTVIFNAITRVNCIFTTDLQIGGFSRQRLAETNSISYRSYESIIRSGRGFLNACIGNIKYGATRNEMRDISNKYIERNKVYDGCILNYCHKPDPVCKNKGKCKPSKNATNVECDCRWTGFDGPFCEKLALEITLDGTYKVKHKIQHAFSPRKESYIFRIKTLQKNAVLFYAKGPSGCEDFMLIEIRNSRMKVTVNFGAETNYTLLIDVNVSDGNWHTVRYKKVDKPKTSINFSVDAMSQEQSLPPKSEYVLLDYDKYSYFGEITKSNEPYPHPINIEDFIWVRPNTADVNFVTGLFESYKGHNRGYIVEPSSEQPVFNRRLPSSTPQLLPYDPPSSTDCTEGSCSTEGSDDVPTPSRKIDEIPKALVKDEDESSVTWIIVVTVVFSLLLLAAIAFFVYKWNQRYSGDFQVNRKPIGPAGMVVHYQDTAAHKEKQRQMKL